jgi:hypothetical protein
MEHERRRQERRLKASLDLDKRFNASFETTNPSPFEALIMLILSLVGLASILAFAYMLYFNIHP